MAYQPYNYNPLYPNGYGTQNYIQQPYMQPQATQQTGSLIEVRYAKYEEAKHFLITEPGKKMLFIITDKPMMIFKATDGMGISSTEEYKTQKIDNIPTDSKTLEFDPKEFAKTSDLNGFVKEETFNAKFDEFSKVFLKQIDDLSNKINSVEVNKDAK